jgi:hypothetical protein
LAIAACMPFAVAYIVAIDNYCSSLYFPLFSFSFHYYVKINGETLLKEGRKFFA